MHRSSVCQGYFQECLPDCHVRCGTSIVHDPTPKREVDRFVQKIKIFTKEVSQISPPSRFASKLPLSPTHTHQRAFQTLNAMERQDLEDAIPRFQDLWTTFDAKGSGDLPPKHLFTVRKHWVRDVRSKV